MGIVDRIKKIFKSDEKSEDLNMMISAEKVAKYGEEADVKDWEKAVDEDLRNRELRKKQQKITRELLEKQVENAQERLRIERAKEKSLKEWEEKHAAEVEAENEEKNIKAEKDLGRFRKWFNKGEDEYNKRERTYDNVLTGTIKDIEKDEAKTLKKVGKAQEWFGNPFTGTPGKPLGADRLVAAARKTASQIKAGTPEGTNVRNVVCNNCKTLYNNGTIQDDLLYMWQKGDSSVIPTFEYPANEKKCPVCGTPNPIYRKATPLSESMYKNTKGKIYEFFIFEVTGILSLVIPPFFGLPQLYWLALALMLFIPAYMAMPSEYHVLDSLESGRLLNLNSKPAGFLMAKSIFKIIALSLIIFQFYVGFTIFRIICVIVAFLFYFSMPTHYKTTQPYKMIEAWFRMGLGAFIAFILSLTFGGFGPGSLGTGFLYLGLAFFFTFPTQIEDEEGIIKLVGLKGLSENKSFKMVEAILFVALMILAGMALYPTLSGAGGTSNLMFWAFYALAFIVGLTAGPESRPTMGIIMIFLMMFILTSSYPGYVGQAIFGYWWPQISGFADTFMGPLNSALGQAQSGLGDVWLMMTNPQQYYLNMQAKNQATKSVIMTGGTSMSIEINKFELIPSMPGILEPSEPTIGNMELQNQGDFISGQIDLNIWSVWVNATENIEHQIGSISNLQCSNLPIGIIPVQGQNAYCNWNGKTYPTEMRSITFKLDENSAWGVLYTDCMDNSQPTPAECACFSVCPSGSSVGNTTYKYSGITVKTNANLTYSYVVNVSMPINIISSSLYLDKLQNGEMILQDLTSEYTGGPVKATLFTQKQPARTDIPFLVVASIYNDGQGELLNITDFNITIYGGNAIKDVTIIGTDFRKSAPSLGSSADGCDKNGNGIIDAGDVDKTSLGNFIISCSNTWDKGIVKPGEFKRISFYIVPNENMEDQKTTLITGMANYYYRKTTSQTLTVANAPPQ